MFGSSAGRLRRRTRRRATRELGLELFHRLLRFTLKSEHLHYGLFEPDIPVEFANLKRAQDRYAQRLIELIPAGTRSILDVGCGTGTMAELLLDSGYLVDCVSPGDALTAIAAKRLGTRVTMYHGRYEEVAIPKRYDLVLFSESFQYVPIEAALNKSLSLLNPGGHILISDFFKDTSKGKCSIGGGHSFSNWCKAYRRHPVDLLVERDVTDATAPLHDILQKFLEDVAQPTWETSLTAASIRWPLSTRIARFVFRSGIRKLEQRRLSTERNAATFRHYKLYKTYLFKARSEAAPAAAGG